MYFLYLDDSGSMQNKNERYIVLGGVCIFERRIHWVTKRLDELASKIHPTDPNSIEFHASAIYAANIEPWKSYSPSQRIKTIKNVLHVLDNEHESTVIFACAVHKDSFLNSDPIELAFEELCNRFDLFLRRIYFQSNKKDSQRGILVLDNSTYETSLQKLATEFRQIGTRWGKTIRNIVDVPLFVDSKASRLIQLADHIAYAVFRRYQAEDISYLNIIEGRIDSERGKIHGLVHKQHYNPACKCPACISRFIQSPTTDLSTPFDT